MTTAILIDDEKNALEVLEILLQKYCPEIKIVAICNSGQKGIEAIKKWKPSLVFLDIEMPNLNGFDVLNATKEMAYKVIFTTAYDKFAIKAFKYSAIDYLLKPIDIIDLQNAVAKIRNENITTNLEAQVNALFAQLNFQKQQSEKIALPIGNTIEFFESDEIMRIESESNYSHIFLVNGKKITLSKTLKEVAEHISGAPFFRIHQSHLINTNHILKIIKEDGAYIVMKDGTNLPISRNKKDDFFELFRKI
jgi:two-component system, LytTR family, response regulator